MTHTSGRRKHAKSTTRRRFLAAAFGLGSAAALARIGGGISFAEDTATEAAAATTATAASGTLPIPEQLVATVEDGVSVFALEARAGSNSSLVSGDTVSTAGYNGTTLGPTMLVSDGEQVRFEVTNSLGDDTTVHWHGLHIAPSMDGGPQNIIADGETWTPQTTINQGEACTLWYHPHGLGTTADQVALGLAGLLIVDDGSTANATLPTAYGADDIPLIMQSTGVSSSGAFVATNAAFTASGTTLKFLVNGASATDGTKTLEVAYRRVRLRLLNASLIDSITVARSDGATLTQVASDAGLLTAPLDVSTLRLTPGERAEVVLDLTANSDVTLNATVRNTTNGTRYTVSMLTVGTTGTDTPADLPPPSTPSPTWTPPTPPPVRSPSATAATPS
jgi:FtsP/CotA-like multicopper oxidase with cupredoxin domain